MKKFLFRIGLSFPILVNAVILDVKDVNPNDYVLLVSTSPTENGAIEAASKLSSENIFILKDENKYTVRVVNLKNIEEARVKLKEVKKIFTDAIHWKKMTFLAKSDSLKITMPAVVKPKVEQSTIVNDVTTTVQEKLVFENSNDGNSITQLIKDTNVYSGPAPYGKQKDEFKKGYYVQGVFNETKDWFVIIKISTNKTTWFDIPSPLWMNLNNL